MGKGGEQSQDPQIAGGFDFIPGLVQQLTGQAQQGFGGPFVQGAGSGELDFLSQLQGLDIPGLLGSGFQGLQGIAGGSLQDAAAPGLSRLLDVGGAALNEQAALGGVLSSSGAQQNQADFTANTVSQLQQALAPLQLGAAQSLASPATAGIGGQAFGKERGIQDQGIQRMIQDFQQQQSLIPGLLSGTGAAASGTPIFQPTTDSSKMESMLQVAAPIAGGMFGGPIGAKAGSAIAGGGGGKGGGAPGPTGKGGQGASPMGGGKGGK